MWIIMPFCHFAILPGFLTLGRCEGDDGNLAASGPLPEEEAVAGTGTQAGLSAAATEEEGSFEESPKWAGPREGFVFKLGSRGLGYYTDAHQKKLRLFPFLS